MEGLAQSWKRLSLSEREGPDCCLTAYHTESSTAPEKKADGERYKQGVFPQSMCNVNSGFNSINATIPHSPQPANSVSNGFLKRPGVIDMGQHEAIQEVHTSERSDKQQVVNVAFSSREEVSNGKPSQEHILQTPHVLARVSTHAKQGRGLPSLTRRWRPASHVQKIPTKEIKGKKRELGVSDDCVETLSKRHPISQNVEEASFILAEADNQPHQE